MSVDGHDGKRDVKDTRNKKSESEKKMWKTVGREGVCWRQLVTNIESDIVKTCIFDTPSESAIGPSNGGV